MATVRGYARLLRLPLFVTAMADSVAGYLVARLGVLPPTASGGPLLDGRTMLLLAGTSAGLYLFGMVENDLADVKRDRLMELDRPLVTGEAGYVGTALILAFCLALAAGCAAMLPGAAALPAIGTFAVVNLYNLAAKRGPAHIAMIIMGLTRFLNFGIGVGAAIGIPREQIDWGLLAADGPLWMKHGLAIFMATFVVTGYSVAARNGIVVSTRPWQAFFMAALVGGLALLAAAPLHVGARALTAPVARLGAALLLPMLWPGPLLWAGGHERRPEQYAPFIERMLYWLIVMDAAFVLDAFLTRPR